MERPTERLELIAEQARATLGAKDAAREQGLRMSREALRHSTDAIRAVHRGEYADARERLAKARALFVEIYQTLEQHPELLHAGFVYNAEKEYVEGCATLGLIAENSLPSPEELEVGYAAYLNGLGEAVGELRRHILDILRKGEVSRCEELLGAMDDIYSILVTMDFPDAMTQGLRRTTDAVRGILERTRGDITLATRQSDLAQRLASVERRLGTQS